MGGSTPDSAAYKRRTTYAGSNAAMIAAAPAVTHADANIGVGKWVWNAKESHYTEGDFAAYRCEDCLDRFDLEVTAEDLGDIGPDQPQA